MRKNLSIKLLLFIISLSLLLLLFSCGKETPFIPTYQSPEANMVLVEGGTYTMGDWLQPYYLDQEVSQGMNIKDLSLDAERGLDFTFDMRATHDVTVDSFYISKYELTFEEFDRYCYEMKGYLHSDGFDGNADAPANHWGRGNRPAINVSWVNAINYCNWLSVKEGLKEPYELLGLVDIRWYPSRNGYRLPTEAEWEYAARSGHLMPTINNGQGHLYSGCDDIAAMDTMVVTDVGVVDTDPYTSVEGADGYFNTLRDYAWLNLNSGWKDKDATLDDNGQTWPVGTKKPNELGLHDMAGNVWEWCWDWYSPDYYAYCQSHPGENDNPKGPENVGDIGAIFCHTLRGGTWANYPVFLRTTFRFFSMKQALMGEINPTYEYSNWRTGMRICRNAE